MSGGSDVITAIYRCVIESLSSPRLQRQVHLWREINVELLSPTNVFLSPPNRESGHVEEIGIVLWEGQVWGTPRWVYDSGKVGTILTGIIEISVCRAILCTRSERRVSIRRRSRFHILTPSHKPQENNQQSELCPQHCETYLFPAWPAITQTHSGPLFNLGSRVNSCERESGRTVISSREPW